MDEYDFDNFEILENGVAQNKHPSRTFPLWKFLVMLVTVFVVMVLTSFVICIGSSQCRQAVPTVHVLLTSPLTAPYMILGLSAGLYVFFITCLALYVKTESKLIIFTGIGVYGSVGAILVVFPFTGWDRNWAIFGFIVAYMVWMCAVARAFYRTYEDALKRLQFVAIVVYAACGLVYTVLKLVPRDTRIGLLVVEVVGAIMVIGYMAVCLAFVWGVKITVSPT